jgi:type I restriction enzyme S subunit
MQVTSPQLLPVEGAPARARQLLAAGDTVFSTVRPYLKKIAWIPPDLDGEIASTGFCVLRPRTDVLHPRFLFYFATSDALLDQVLPLQRGVSYPAVRDADVLGSQIALPPLDEQVSIVNTLDDHLSRLDSAGASIRAVNRLAAAYERSGIQAALLSVPISWMPLSQVLSEIEAGKSFTCLPRESHEGEWGVIKVSAMTWGEFMPSENKAVPPGHSIDARFEIRQGDILVSRANTAQYVGAPVMVRTPPDRLLLSDKSLRLLPRPDVDADWLIAALQAPSTRQQISALATGTKDSMRNISQKALLSVEVPVPDEVRYQSEVAKRAAGASQARSQLAGAGRTIAKRRVGLRRSLLQAAFSGHLTRESLSV